MDKECLNIYKKARLEAGFTREQVYALTNISDSSLKAYESGKTIPGDETVLILCEAYKAEWLGLEHLAKTNPIIKRYATAIPIRGLCENIARFQAEKADVDNIITEIIRMACDGKLEPKARKELSELAGSAMALLAAA